MNARLVSFVFVNTVVFACGVVNDSPSRESHGLLFNQKSKLAITYETSEVIIPSMCTESSKAEQEFWKGVTKGEKIADKLWQKEEGCNSLEVFTDTLIDNLYEIELRKEDSHKIEKRCNYIGQIDGVFSVLWAVEQECADACVVDGTLVGELAAKVYCDLVIATAGGIEVDAWIRGPVGMCGLFFQIACDSSFMGITYNYENSYGVCAPYTIGEYSDIYTRSRLKACDYPEDPPDD